MLESNRKEFEKCRIDWWHKSGFKGQGVRIAVLDTQLESDNTMTYANFPLGESPNGGHGVMVTKVLHEVAPNAIIDCYPYLDSPNRQKVISHIIKNKYDLVNVSLAVINSRNEPIELLKNTNIPIIASSGNDGKENFLKYPASADWTIAVGAYSDALNKNTIYSNCGENLDCLGFGGLYFLNEKGREGYFTGTSCAAPFITGMLACWFSYCKQIGFTPNREQTRTFIYKNCIDIGTKGKDYETGMGLFILPDKITPNVIEMKLNSREATINGEKQLLDVAPYTKNDRTMVPLRAIAEMFGAEVQWDGKTQKIKIIL